MKSFYLDGYLKTLENRWKTSWNSRKEKVHSLWIKVKFFSLRFFQNISLCEFLFRKKETFRTMEKWKFLRALFEIFVLQVAQSEPRSWRHIIISLLRTSELARISYIFNFRNMRKHIIESWLLLPLLLLSLRRKTRTEKHLNENSSN